MTDMLNRNISGQSFFFMFFVKSIQKIQLTEEGHQTEQSIKLKLSVFKDNQVLNTLRQPITATFINGWSKPQKFQLSFMTKDSNSNRKVNFTLKLQTIKNSTIQQKGQLKIDPTKYIHTLLQAGINQTQQQNIFSQYRLQYIIFIDPNRHNLQKIVKGYKNSQGYLAYTPNIQQSPIIQNQAFYYDKSEQQNKYISQFNNNIDVRQQFQHLNDQKKLQIVEKSQIQAQFNINLPSNNHQSLQQDSQVNRSYQKTIQIQYQPNIQHPYNQQKQQNQQQHQQQHQQQVHIENNTKQNENNNDDKQNIQQQQSVPKNIHNKDNKANKQLDIVLQQQVSQILSRDKASNGHYLQFNQFEQKQQQSHQIIKNNVSQSNIVKSQQNQLRQDQQNKDNNIEKAFSQKDQIYKRNEEQLQSTPVVSSIQQAQQITKFKPQVMPNSPKNKPIQPYIQPTPTNKNAGEDWKLTLKILIFLILAGFLYVYVQTNQQQIIIPKRIINQTNKIPKSSKKSQANKKNK